MSAAAEPGDPGRSGSGPDQAETQAQVLSALEEALRQALATLPRDQVMKHIAAALPAEILIEDTPRLHGGKVRKVSVSMPEELTEAVRARTGAGGFSRYVADAVSREIRHDLLGDLLEELDAEYGPVPEDIRAETRRMWPDYDEE